MGRLADEALALAWKRRIARQGRGRLSIAAFCRREGVSPPSFYAWRRRLRADSAEPCSTLFVPVELPTEAIGATGVRIELPGGAVVSLPADAPVELVTAAIRAVVLSVAATVLGAAAQERPSC